MCTNRIEITKQYDIPLRVRYVQIGQDLLQHSLCLSVRIRDLALRAFFCDRYKGRISVYSRGGTENQLLHTMVPHDITEI